ncbi:MTLALPHA1 [[Candida] subhashii]|uniref:MTLALPHA1 n=1 Tax=[Candida] subhashii TaxID=561895 RepID=A0A8J5UEW0_9ASCO|nr:MTLALPHA1 [[Candida] subhashii]KAG7661518.1 MTLALPHA1 [[Candida] subhashii]
MRRNKSIPKELTSQFRVSKKKMQLQKDLALNVPKNSNVEFRISSLPDLPTPSKELQELIFEYKLSSDLYLAMCPPKKQKLSKPKRGSKPINSFIAFRSFYTRAIRHPNYQREISQKLAKLWLTEPSKSIWDQYTESYNNYLSRGNKGLGLVDWLTKVLNIDLTEDIAISQDHFVKPFNSGTVQDIYLFDR